MSVLTAPPATPASPAGPPKLSAPELRRAQAETLRTPRFRYSAPARLLWAGAAGFLVKDTDAAELIRAVRVVASGEAILAPGEWSWPVNAGWRRLPPGMMRSPQALVPGSH